MTTPAKARRTPAQIAADELADTEAQLARVEKRLDRLDAETRAARARQAELKQLRDYRAQHPLLRRANTNPAED